jgi:hypothetical protein
MMGSDHGLLNKTALCKLRMGKTGLGKHGFLWILHHLKFWALKHLHNACVAYAVSFHGGSVTVRIYPRVYTFF